MLNGPDALEIVGIAAASMAAAVPQGSVEVIPGENHGWVPDAFAQRVTAFTAAPTPSV